MILRDRVGRVLILSVDEEEELVFDDRSAEREAVRLGAFASAVAEVVTVDGVPAQALVAVVGVGRTLEGVRTRLGDGVDAAAHEVRLAHIEGRYNHLKLLDSVERDRVTAAGQGAREAEVVVQVGPIDGERVRTSVAAGDHGSAARVRRHAREVRQAAVDGGQELKLLLGDVRRGARLQSRELRRGGGDDHLVQRQVVAEHRVQRRHFAQLERHVAILDGLQPDVRHGDLVRPAGAHTLDRIATVDVRDGAVLRARRLMHGHDGGADERFALLVCDLSADGGRCDLCRCNGWQDHC